MTDASELGTETQAAAAPQRRAQAWVRMTAIGLLLGAGAVLLAQNLANRSDSVRAEREAQAAAVVASSEADAASEALAAASDTAASADGDRRSAVRALAVARRKARAASDELRAAISAADALVLSDQDQAALGAELVDHLRAGRSRLYNTRRDEFNAQYGAADSPGAKAYDTLRASSRAFAEVRPGSRSVR